MTVRDVLVKHTTVGRDGLATTPQRLGITHGAERYDVLAMTPDTLLVYSLGSDNVATAATTTDASGAIPSPLALRERRAKVPRTPKDFARDERS
jgi:hypothetical protein